MTIGEGSSITAEGSGVGVYNEDILNIQGECTITAACSVYNANMFYLDGSSKLNGYVGLAEGKVITLTGARKSDVTVNGNEEAKIAVGYTGADDEVYNIQEADLEHFKAYEEETYKCTLEDGSIWLRHICVDSNHDHKCDNSDTCEETFAEHKAAENEHDCAYCGKPVTKCEDNVEKIAAVAPDCTEAGNSEYYKCKVCGKLYTSDTCETETTEEAVTIPANGHKFENNKASESKASDATCTEAAKYYVQCDSCDEVNENKTVSVGESKGHSFTDYTSDGNATCEEDGTKTAKCDHGCGKTDTVTDKGSASGHSWDEGKITTAPTCTEKGVKMYTCQNDGTHTMTEIIPANGHTDADENYRCDVCGENLCQGEHVSETISAVAATCESAGLTEGTRCSRCGDILKAQEVVAPLGHSWDEGKITTVPTCTENGVKMYTCQNDGTHTMTEIIPANGHTDADENYRCDVCGVNLCQGEHVSETISAVAATCESAGLTEGTRCSRCGDILKAQEVVAPLGHSFTNYESNGDGTMTALCDHNCGKSDTITDPDSTKEEEDDDNTKVEEDNDNTKVEEDNDSTKVEEDNDNTKVEGDDDSTEVKCGDESKAWLWIICMLIGFGSLMFFLDSLEKAKAGRTKQN